MRIINQSRIRRKNRNRVSRRLRSVRSRCHWQTRRLRIIKRNVGWYYILLLVYRITIRSFDIAGHTFPKIILQLRILPSFTVTYVCVNFLSMIFIYESFVHFVRRQRIRMNESLEKLKKENENLRREIERYKKEEEIKERLKQQKRLQLDAIRKKYQKMWMHFNKKLWFYYSFLVKYNML